MVSAYGLLASSLQVWNSVRGRLSEYPDEHG